MVPPRPQFSPKGKLARQFSLPTCSATAFVGGIKILDLVAAQMHLLVLLGTVCARALGYRYEINNGALLVMAAPGQLGAAPRLQTSGCPKQYTRSASRVRAPKFAQR